MLDKKSKLCDEINNVNYNYQKNPTEYKKKTIEIDDAPEKVGNFFSLYNDSRVRKSDEMYIEYNGEYYPEGGNKNNLVKEFNSPISQ